MFYYLTNSLSVAAQCSSSFKIVRLYNNQSLIISNSDVLVSEQVTFKYYT